MIDAIKLKNKTKLKVKFSSYLLKILQERSLKIKKAIEIHKPQLTEEEILKKRE